MKLLSWPVSVTIMAVTCRGRLFVDLCKVERMCAFVSDEMLQHYLIEQETLYLRSCCGLLYLGSHLACNDKMIIECSAPPDR